MSSSGRADGRTAAPRDVYSMPRDFSYTPDSNKEKRRERDIFTRRLSGSISLDGGASRPPSKRRATGGEQSYTGRLVGITSNGWHEDLISRSRSHIELGTHSGISSGVAPLSPRLEPSGGDGSPKELDGGCRISKPGSPFTQARSSPLVNLSCNSFTGKGVLAPSVNVSCNSFTGKGVLAREQSRCSEWEAPYKMDMDFRDKIWGKFDLYRRAGSSGYEAATVPTMHKDIDGRQEDGRRDDYGGSVVDSAGVSSYHIRSYQEWRLGDRITSSLLPLRTHSSSNGYLKESGSRTQGAVDVVGSYSSTWHSPLSSPVNHTGDFGRDDGSQISPRKRPRLGWGQGLAKYEKKRIEGTEDNLTTKGRVNSCSEEIITSHAGSPHQGAGRGQEISFAKTPADNAGDICFEVEKDIPILQIEQTETTGIDAMMDKNRDFESMPASMIDRLDFGQSPDVSLASKEYESIASLPQSQIVQPQIVFPGQCCSEDASGGLKENILQILEKLELELELTEKELGKLEVQPEPYSLRQNGCVVEVGRSSVVVEVQTEVLTVGQNDSGEKVPKDSGITPGKAVNDEQIEMSPVGVQETSVCLLPKSDELQPLCEVQHQSASDSLPEATVSGKGDDGMIQDNEDNSQGSSLKGRPPPASFSMSGEITSAAKGTFAQSLPQNGGIQIKNININSQTLNRKEVNECWKVLYDKNQDQAKHAFQAFANLLPEASFSAEGVFHGKPEDVPAWEEKMECNERNKQQLQNMVLQEKLFLRFREQVLALKYRALRETWKREQAGLCQWSDCAESLRKWDIERRNGTLLPTQRTSHRLRLSVSGATKVDAATDEVHTMQKLLSEPFGGYQRLHLKMPSQILDEKEKHFRRFITNNALIEDPVAFEQERKTINPWTPEEKKIFLDTFFLYNKNFQKIASFLEHKTIADCIEFYYRNQKSEEFEMVRRRQQLKNRRDYSRPSAYLATTTPPSNRRREINAVGADVLPVPTAIALCNDNGRVFCSTLSNNAHSDAGAVGLSSFNNPLGNSEHTDKMKGAQSICSQSLMSNMEEFDSQWTDNERQLFVAALGLFGKDFGNISQHVATKSEGQCKAFFSKTRKRLGLDQVLEAFQMGMHEHFDQGMDDTGILNTTACVEDMHVDIAQSLVDVKDEKGTNICECSLLACNDRVEMVSGNLTEEPLVVTNLKSKALKKDEDEQNIEDEKLVALPSQERNDTPESSEGKVLSIDNEERIESKEQVNPPFLIGSLSLPNDDMADCPSITAEPVPDSGTDAEHANGTMAEQVVHTGEQLSNTQPSKSGSEDGASMSTPVADAFERPVVEEKELFVDPVKHIMNESPNECLTMTQISHNSSTLACVAPVTTNVSVVTSSTQSKGRGSASGGEAKPRREATSWTQDEKGKFVEIIRKHGRDWTLLQENLPAKSLTQIKTYFQNSKAKLGFTAGEGTTNLRTAASRKSRVDDSDSSSTLYNLAQHKASALSDDSGLKSDQIINGSLSTVLGMPGSDGVSFALLGKGTCQAEDPAIFNGVQKLFQQMSPNGYSQQAAAASNMFSVFHPSTLPVFTASGFQQPQNLSLQSLSNSASPKQQLVNPQTQQLVGIQQQSQVSSAMCNLQSQLLHQIKQQQKTSQVVSHCQQDYQNQNQNQGIHQLQTWIMQQQQQQVMQSLQQSITPSLLQQQQPSPPQPQVVLQQPNQQQHLPQGALHIQQVINQNLHYLKQQPSHQSLSQLTAVANQLLSSNPQINQHQLPNQQQLTNQFQSHQHYEDQQKQHHVLQNQVSQQQQHSLLGNLQEKLTLKLHHQQHLQLEKQLQPLRVNLQTHLLENSEISHQQQGQALETLSEKDHKQRQDTRKCQSVTLHRGGTQIICKDISNLRDCKGSRNGPKSLHYECERLQSSQVNVQVLAHTKSKPEVFLESHQTRSGDVKLFGQVLLSQPTSSVKSAASTSEKNSPQLTLPFSSIPVSTVASSVSEALPSTFPNGALCVPSGFGRIGVSFSHGQDHHHPWQGAPAGSIDAWNSLLDGRQYAALAKVMDSEVDTHNNQAMVSRVTKRPTREAKECESSHSEGSSSSQRSDVGEQLKRLQDGQTLVQGLGIKTATDQSSSLVLRPGDISGANFDLRSDTLRVSGVSDLSSMMSRREGPDLCSIPGTLLGVPVSSSQSLPGVVMDALLALAEWQSSQEVQYVGGHSSEEHHPSQDSLRNNACNVIEGGKSSVIIGQALPSIQSIGGGAENPQVTRDNSFFGQKALVQASGHGGLNVSTWASGASDLQRVIVPAVSSIRSHGSMPVEGQSRLADSRDTEDTGGIA